MTKLTVLSSTERERFDSPPKFNADERAVNFSLSNEIIEMLNPLRTSTNKVGFLLQLGYFKSHAKFYTPAQFRKADIEYVTKIIGIKTKNVFINNYDKKTSNEHQKKILNFLRWSPLSDSELSQINHHVTWHVQNQLQLKQVFFSAIDFCWQNKIELPSYNQLATIITNTYNQHETTLLGALASLLTQTNQNELNILMSIDEEGQVSKNRMQRYPLTFLRHVNQSLRPSDIQKSVGSFSIVREYFYKFQDVIDRLSLSDQATEYFSTWVQKANLFQLSQFPDRNKLYLHLLAYIKHQFFYRQDLLVDVLLKSVQGAINAANKKMNENDKENAPERIKNIKKISRSSKDSRTLIEAITNTINSIALSDSGKVAKIKELLGFFNEEHTEDEKLQLIEIEKSLEKSDGNHDFFDILESLSISLQRRVSSVLKLLDFDLAKSDSELIEAITYFKVVDGELNSDAPLDFLSEKEKKCIHKDGKLRISFYKILLFIHVADAIKSGKLNLKYSYRYKAFDEYLISKDVFENDKENMLRLAGLSEYRDPRITLDMYKTKLNNKYHEVNKRFDAGENSMISVKKEKIHIRTPKIENVDKEYISSLLTQAGHIPILQVLADTNNTTNFIECFKHHAVKNKKMNPDPQTIFAGIIGNGCNIGISRIANISVGVTEGILKNTVNWCFSLENIQAANNSVLAMINKLALPNAFKRNKDQLHTGSDGRKVNVGVDSIHASYSYKYFGKGKGVTMYTFLDERQLLYYSTVISSSEREAAYVIDGLMENEVVKSDIHSTDSHGYTETIFAATSFLGVSFAPRFKRISEQKIYSFSPKKTYAKQGYKILPSRPINQKLIIKNWDDILRFIATIKLKYTTASQLFKRLSSYAKDHPLYQALKEFGRIAKSLFILTYYDNVDLRQKIQKQLNMVELSNKFSKAVFFASNQEFKQGEQKEQKIATACMVLIQNTIVLWNYLYLSQLLANNADQEHRMEMIQAMQNGSVITWQHINLHGEYDFTKHPANDMFFDMTKILALSVA